MIVILCLFIAICVIVGVSTSNKEAKKKLHDEYQQAIASGDKRAALAAGRAYYARLRGGKLTIFDEQALTNDLSTMS